MIGLLPIGSFPISGAFEEAPVVPTATPSPTPSATPIVIEGPLIDVKAQISIIAPYVKIHSQELKDVELSEIHSDERIIDIGTSEETIVLSSDISNKGYLYMLNMDAANYVDVGYATGVYPKRVRPDTADLTQLAPATTTLYVKASGTGTKFLYSAHAEPV